MKRARLTACLFVPAIVAACSSFAATNPADGQGNDAGDDVGADAGIDHVVTGTAPEAGTTNLLTDGTFESSCTAWTGDHLAVTWESDQTHNHSYGACRVCFLGDNSPSGTITASGVFGAGADRQLSAAVFVLAASSTPQLQANIVTNVVSQQGASGGGGVSLPINITTTDWAQLALPVPFQSKDAPEAQVIVQVYAMTGNAGDGTECFYVDDASLFFVTK